MSVQSGEKESGTPEITIQCIRVENIVVFIKMFCFGVYRDVNGHCDSIQALKY